MLTWNFKVRGKVELPTEVKVLQSTTAAVAVLSFAPQVVGLPCTRVYALSPKPTEMSAEVERGMMADVGPTVKSSPMMFS